ncbi:c-type cytochrome [Duganella sp. sic0402]|uniref:c-type cytochrome n=1 Tax=Duganella sp. sic0402 TaxID=2854786 RepID=UPI001C453DF9|nr:c-type cytochrome [Duganella sp. sic0402]MBV7535046.1 c-type cytochrome [Duganella sp. sic0402]
MSIARRRFLIATIIATLAVLASLAAMGGALVLYGGFYNAGATRSHFQWVHSLLEIALHRSVRQHARDITPPAELNNSMLALRGAGLYRDNCVVCHGAPGVAQGDIGKSMQPIPGPLADAARRWQPNELYWITRHGIKMSGMPAWQYHLADQDIWALVAFLTVMPALSPPAYEALIARAGHPQRAARPAHALPDAERGRLALTQYACNACHQIDGVTGPATMVGPPLAKLAKRQYIAGHLPNSADNLARWIQEPQRYQPQSAMPAMGVSESDARDIAAYLLQP